MLEVKPGVFISKISAIVREALWKKVQTSPVPISAVLAYSAPTELGFQKEMIGEPTRQVIDMEGLQLIKIV